MSKSDEYRQKAADCHTKAEQCKDGWAKEVWLETAATWHRLGSQYEQTIERKSPPRTRVHERQS
jgi:hypothetical protein